MSGEIIETLRECAEMVSGGRQNGLTEFWHSEAAKVTAEACEAAADALDAKDKRIAELEADNRRMKRRLETSLKFWIRAAKAALAGDPRELQNRVDLFEAEPVAVVLSSPAGEANG